MQSVGACNELTIMGLSRVTAAVRISGKPVNRVHSRSSEC
jgi:hypothetical protein